MKISLRPAQVCLAALIVFTGFHLYRFNDPPNGKHQWRESLTAMVAENYYQEDLSFLKPRVHNRGNLTGITGMEFPIYSFLAGLLFYLFGPMQWVLHLVTLAAALLCIWLLYRIVTMVCSAWEGAMAAAAMAVSPLFFFYSYKIIPDVTMTALYLAAVYLYLRFLREGRAWLWVVSLAGMGMAGSIKPLALAALLPLLYLAWRDSKHRVGRVALVLGYAVLAVVMTAGWLYYARMLSRAYGVHAFEMNSHLGESLAIVGSGLFFKLLVVQWPFEIWFGWFVAPAFVYGVYRAVRDRKGGFFAWWIAACYVVFALTAVKSTSHDYYNLVVVPPVAAFTGIGLGALWQRAGGARILAVVILVLSPVWALHRIDFRFGPTDEFFRVRAASEAYLPKDKLVIVDDRTPADLLYALNRNGWSLRNKVDSTVIVGDIRDGGEYLLLWKPVATYGDSVAVLTTGTPQMIGPLYCYHVVEPDTTVSR